MTHHHTEPKLLRVGDDNPGAISIDKEDGEFAATLRLAVALTSPIAMLRAVRLCTVVIYLTESEFDPPSELHVHPFSQTVQEAGEFGGINGHNNNANNKRIHSSIWTSKPTTISDPISSSRTPRWRLSPATD
eukprot:jgi/Tetstr1/448682/TSEL_035922.t1